MDDLPDPIDPFIWKKTGKKWTCTALSSPELKAVFIELQDYLDSLHGPILDLKRHLRDEQRDRLNGRSGLHDICFNVGDLVLISSHGTSKRRSKIHLTWTGPYKITQQINEFVYEVQGLNGEKFESHVQRIKFYDTPSSALETEEVYQQFLFNCGKFEIEKLLKLRFVKRSGDHQILVKWRGLDPFNDSWEPVDTLFADVPDLVLNFLEKHNTLMATRLLQRLTANNTR